MRKRIVSTRLSQNKGKEGKDEMRVRVSSRRVCGDFKARPNENDANALTNVDVFTFVDN